MSDNVYDDHPLMINSGQFWRCKHGNTGLDNNANWIGCLACAEEKIDSLRTRLAEKDAEIEAMRNCQNCINFGGIDICVKCEENFYITGNKFLNWKLAKER